MRHIREYSSPEVNIFVGYKGELTPENHNACYIGSNITFDLKALASYFFNDRSELSYDAFVLAAAVEYADYFKKRPRMGWARSFFLDVPVSNPEAWNTPHIRRLIVNALNMLTGDSWKIHFRQRSTSIDWPEQTTLKLPTATQAVIAFSEGMDSLAVGGLSKIQLGDQLVQLRLGKKNTEKGAPFIAVPFNFHLPKNVKKNSERSGRSRGFKFAILSIVASLLSKSSKIIVPESGQGAIGPALITLSRIPPDYRNHPSFFHEMEKLAAELLGISVTFEIPRLWNTKGQTLKKYVEETNDKVKWPKLWGSSGMTLKKYTTETNDHIKWPSTTSCWRDARFVSFEKEKRQCGICAACLLRRMSVHAAGLTETTDQYLWHDLTVQTFENGTIKPFEELKGQDAYLKYARAAVCHLQDLAYLDDPTVLNINAGKIARAHRISKSDVMSKQVNLLNQHRYEWENFLKSLGPSSFIAKWVVDGGKHAA